MDKEVTLPIFHCENYQENVSPNTVIILDRSWIEWVSVSEDSVLWQLYLRTL